jgi:hypothetical protein
MAWIEHVFDRSNTTKEKLLLMAKAVTRLGNLYEGPDGCGTAGTDLVERIARDLTCLSSMEHVGMHDTGAKRGEA